MSGGPFGLGSGHDGARRSRAAYLPGFHRPPIPRRLEDNRILMLELVVPNPEDPDGSSALYPLAPSSTSAPATTRLNRDKTRLCQLLLAQQRLLIRCNFSGLPVEVPEIRVSERRVEVHDEKGLWGTYWDTHVTARVSSICATSLGAHITLCRHRGRQVDWRQRQDMDNLRPALVQRLRDQAISGVWFTGWYWNGDQCFMLFEPNTPMQIALVWARNKLLRYFPGTCEPVVFHVTIDDCNGVLRL